MLAHAMLSIPATKGFEIGSGILCCGKFLTVKGFEGTKMKGSQHNDHFVSKEGKSDKEEKKIDDQPALLKTKTNNSGGTLGGISSGENIVMKAF